MPMASLTLLSFPRLTCSGSSPVGVLGPTEVQRQQEALAVLERHIGEFLLGELDPADRAVELVRATWA